MYKYFKNAAATEVYAYLADGSQDEFIKQGLIAISAAEADEIRCPFAQKKSAKKSEIERLRDVAVTADVSVIIRGVEYAFQSDPRSQALLQGELLSVVSGISSAQSVLWRSSDNVDVSVDSEGLRLIGAAMRNQTSAAYERSWALKAQVDAAENDADLDAIQW